jgi:plastocyanin
LTRTARSSALLVFGALWLGLAGNPVHAGRFQSEPTVVPGEADWVVRGAGHTVFGSERKVVIVDGPTIELPQRIAATALVGSRLFLIDESRSLFAIDVSSADAQPARIALEPPLRGEAHLAALQGALAITEDGVGIHLLAVDGGDHTAHHAACPTSFVKRSLLPLNARFGAATARDFTIHAAVPKLGIIEIDAHDRTSPRLARRFPGPGDAVALADDGVRLFALGPRGLSVQQLDDPSSPPQEYPEVRGTGLALAGRRVWVAAGAPGLAAWTDTSPEPLLVEVSVNNNFFSPDRLTVNVGDTVRWTNVTGDLHNVFSCTTSQVGCGGVASQESFTSGPASAFFVDQHTFSQPGSNPYICQPHASFMKGKIDVVGTAAGPPTVPDGTTGSAMKVTRLSADASVLAIDWDTTNCSNAVDYQVLFGHASQLPSAPGGTYALSGSVCAIGTDSPVTWANVPPVTPGGTSWLWWIVVATDGATTEGSWGRDSGGNERNGTAGSGSSGQCGVSGKIINTCGR